MGLLNSLWRKLTHTKALVQSSGKLETAFFESVYRITYLAGLSSYDRGVVYLVYSTTVKLMLVLLVCCEMWHFFTDSSLDGIANSINITFIQFVALYRYKTMIDNRDVFKKLAMAMELRNFDISTRHRKGLVDFWQKRNEKYLKLLLALGNCTLAAWFIYPLVDDLDYNLIVSIRLPFEYRTPSIYPITYVVVVLVFGYAALFVMVNDIIMQAHLMNLLCQFTILADCFRDIIHDCKLIEGSNNKKPIVNNKFTKIYKKRLGNLVDQHKYILNNTMELRNILSAPMLGQLAGSSILICFVGYQAATSVRVNLTKFLMSLLYLGYNLFELYIICRWCDEIRIQSENIGEAVYCSGWESGVAIIPGVKKQLMLVAARANKPIVLTAGGMYDLSLNSYANLVKTSYSALTMLLRLRH